MDHAPASTWCECSACGEGFGGVTLFDAHRVGPIGNRRCVSSEEMSVKGWIRGNNGLWRGGGGYTWGANSPETPAEAATDVLAAGAAK